MGSFNVSCGLSGLPIHDYEKIGFIPLIEKKNYDTNGYGKFYSYADSLYSPYLPPIFGSYDGYGYVTDIEESETTRYVEKKFGISAEDFIACINNYGKPIHLAYGPIATVYENTIPRNSINMTTPDYLTALGFEDNGDGGFQFGDWSLSLTGDGYEIVKNGTGYSVIIPASKLNSIKHDMERFSYHTGTIPGFREEDWNAILEIRSLKGMYIHGDIFSKMMERRGDYAGMSIDKDRDEVYPGELTKLMEKTNGAPEMVQVMSDVSPHLGQFLRNYPELVRFFFDREGKGYEEFLLLDDLSELMSMSNRMFSPGICGSQFGDNLVNKVLAEVVLDYSEKFLEDENNMW